MRLRRTVILKPTVQCNMACGYCYELERAKSHEKPGRLDAAHVVDRFAEAVGEEADFLFLLHGGEPLLMGGAAFDRFVAAMRRARDEHGHEVAFAIQTNATLLTQEWVDRLQSAADFLGERTVGISLDGSASVNDQARRFAHHCESTHTAVAAAMDRLNSAGINYGLLCVVGTHNVHIPVETYSTLTRSGAVFLRFLPCYNVSSSGRFERFGVSPQAFTDFLLAVFEQWVRDLPNQSRENYVVIDPIVSILANLSGSFTLWCEYRSEKCENFISVFPSGDLWLCDSFDHSLHASEAYLGNLRSLDQKGLASILFNPYGRCFFSSFQASVLNSCQSCDVAGICYGACIPARDGLRQASIALSEEFCAARRRLIRGIEAIYRDAVP